MTKSILALANPKLITWARMSAGMDLGDAAKSIGLSEDRLRSWETGRTRPTIAQLRKAARLYRRPLAFFYLSEAPEEPAPLRDFRRLSGGVRRDFTPELRFLIRSARERQEWLVERARERETAPVELVGCATLNDDTVALATRITETLGITSDVRRSWRGADDALRGWLDAIESAGVYVLQAGNIDVAEMRGFTLIDSVVPTIVINASDARAARIFTLLHELGHLTLAVGGISNDIGTQRRPRTQEEAIEVFCNALAGEVLAPAVAVLEYLREHESEDVDQQIESLSRSYRVSKEVIARRLLHIGRIGGKQYEERRKQYRQEYEHFRSRRRDDYRIPHAIIVLRDNGRAFTTQVLSAYADGLITARDVSQLLSVKLKHLARIESEIFPVPVVRGA